MMKPITKIRFSLVSKIALLVMVISMFGIFSIALLSMGEAEDIFLDTTKELVKRSTESYGEFIEEKLKEAKSALSILASNSEIEALFRAYQNPYHYDEVSNKTYDMLYRSITKMMRLSLAQDPKIFQIRLLYKNGKEIVKVVQKGGKVEIIPRSKLQNKAHRDYFQEILHMPPHAIYISDINLNKEFNTLEYPLRPTIRLAKKIYIQKQFTGILIINVDVGRLFTFDRLRNKVIKTYLIDHNGYYIYNQEEPFKEFGFEFGKWYVAFEDFPFIKALWKEQKRVEYDNGYKVYVASRVPIDRERFLVVLKEGSIDAFAKRREQYFWNLVRYMLIIVFSIALITFVAVRWFTKPILKLTKVAQRIASGDEHVRIDIKTGDEIEDLARSLDQMLHSLMESKQEIASFADRLSKEVETKTKELKELNENLQKMVEEKVKELNEKNRALAQQGKLAVMGEMLGAIAHQWRQPLNALAINIQTLEDLYEAGELDKETLEEIVEKSMQNIQFMSHTIDDFRNFFRQDKTKTNFSLKEVVENVLRLQKVQLDNHNIRVEVDVEDVEIVGYKNEFLQMLLNLIANAKDAILERRAKEGEFEGVIKIYTERKGKCVKLVVYDNGVKIPKDVMERMFEPYFTTKEEGKGTGIGLYMAREIVERIGGKLYAKNVEDGVEFIVELECE